MYSSARHDSPIKSQIEPVYIHDLRDVNSNDVKNDYNNEELNKFIKIDMVHRRTKTNTYNPPKLDFYKPGKKDKISHVKDSPSTKDKHSSYQKNKVKLSSAMFNNTHNTMSIFLNKLPNLVYSEERKEKVMLMDSKSSSEINFIEFKTNILLKFAKTSSLFNQIPKYFDNLGEANKHFIKDCYYKLKLLLEKREGVLFDFEKLITNFSMENNLKKWKEYLDLFYNFEFLMESMMEATLKEHKSFHIDFNSKQKIIDEKDIELKNKNKEIDRLKRFIEENNINYKAMNKQNKSNDKGNIHQEFERKERLNQINTFRLEEEIKDLTALLEKDKDFYNKYIETKEVLEKKKKEIEDLRFKFTQIIDEKQISIVSLKNDKDTLSDKILEQEEVEIQLHVEIENSRKAIIEAQTQIKILKGALMTSRENEEMALNEIEVWQVEIEKERQEHFNTKQTLNGLEHKMHILLKEGPGS